MARAEYVAQRTIHVNGVSAYQPGDEVYQSAVDNLDLSIGADGDVLPKESTLIPEPAKNATRDAWVAYALSRGRAEADLEDLGRDAIIALFDEEEE